ncbi:MAG TPA: hypothetical protein DCO69_04215 [Clostridiales bacterium]|nr:hypothetical protein [Clostridiales bacterium]
MIARRPAADVAIRILLGTGFFNETKGNGLPHHPGGWFAMICAMRLLPQIRATPDFRAASATALATAGSTLGSKAAGMT